MILHVGGTSTAGVIVGVIVIFFLIFAMSFAFGSVPEGKRRFTSDWARAWFMVSWPRLLVAGAFSGVLLVGALSVGNGNSQPPDVVCDSPVAPLTGTIVTDGRIVGAIDGVQRLAQAARDGDSNQVNLIFYTEDAHNLTHDIDGQLRVADPDLAKRLCERVLALENQMAGDFDGEVVAIQSDSIATLLQDARAALKAVTATPPPASGLCQSPLDPVSSDPLTVTRITDAADQLRLVGTLAEQGDEAGAEQAFFTDAHNISHDIDGPLRQADQALAVDLCLSVLTLERNFAGGYDSAAVKREADNSASLLEDAGRSLGILQ